MQRTTLDLNALYEINRYPGARNSVDSDVYNLQANLSYALTRRLSALLGYGFTYLRIDGANDSATHTPTIGFGYQVTQSTSFSISGGPAITQSADGTFVSPAGNISLIQQLWRFGSVTLEYAQNVNIGGGFGGTTDHKTASVTFLSQTWIRDLVFRLYASYNRAESLDSETTTQNVDLTSYTVSTGLLYRVWQYASVYAGYDYIRQRTGPQATTQIEGDQHRVRVGFQLGYPINFQ
jgi:opacity protein-like surface antigen